MALTLKRSCRQAHSQYDEPAETPKRSRRPRSKTYPDGIPAYGTDALRFTLAAMAAQGARCAHVLSRVEGYRNFSTKLWNAARFTQMNECVQDDDGF